MTAPEQKIGQRLSKRPWIVPSVGDGLCIIGLLLVGQLSHDINPAADPVGTLETILPFLVGWIGIISLVTVYDETVIRSVSATARRTTVAWIAAANVGLLLRSSPLVDGGAAWPFNLVITGIGVIVLVGWRVGYAWYIG